jgi:hypothetical protein
MEWLGFTAAECLLFAATAASIVPITCDPIRFHLVRTLSSRTLGENKCQQSKHLLRVLHLGVLFPLFLRLSCLLGYFADIPLD